jgi:aminoglycoside phosphotransferase (APT) family kinase protein
MLDDLARRPWLIGRHARTLASLHKRLSAIRAPAWLGAPLGEGEALLHLDLHPDNVIISVAGPVVIDWPNAARGPALSDAAHTWIVVACSLPTAGRYRQLVSRAGRALFLELFLRHFDRDGVSAFLGPAGAYRLANRTLPEEELAAIVRLLDERGPGLRSDGP